MLAANEARPAAVTSSASEASLAPPEKAADGTYIIGPRLKRGQIKISTQYDTARSTLYVTVIEARYCTTSLLRLLDQDRLLTLPR